ncbi:DNA endonuclease SmrA [Ferrimonas marina]|uniref:DNA-nicking endonuclease, Smr domain n=1 Tax=Ferrimonas marina TaxID=299255 RepID=A0A1M5MDL6_9GAMM|nr:DNA endonuclease SmrA [Ferrimonas marina]SHG75494.1 DNA-nicking endonuclease, Smr domain [Ferrimonas marina]
MGKEETDLFLEAMSDVVPLNSADKVVQQERQQASEAQLARRAAAQREEDPAQDALTLEAVDLVDPDDVIGWTRGGMQHGVYKNLRLAKYELEARLDLHGHTVEQARHALLQFVADCQRNDIRCALVLHGKGLNSKPHRGVLKSYVAKWLPMIPEVLAYHTALKQHGGTGAVYVLMRKSPAQKLENRERHQKK